MMGSEQKNKAQVSALMDSELDDAQTSRLLVQMQDDEALTAWALYHRIGDVIRSEDMGLPVSDDFSARFAARFEAELPLCAPKHEPPTRFGAWPAALLAVAATVFGFAVAPTWFATHEAPPPAASVIATDVTADPGTQGVLLADAKSNPALLGIQADYIRMHQASYSPLDGALLGADSRSSGGQDEQ